MTERKDRRYVLRSGQREKGSIVSARMPNSGVDIASKEYFESRSFHGIEDFWHRIHIRGRECVAILSIELHWSCLSMYGGVCKR